MKRGKVVGEGTRPELERGGRMKAARSTLEKL